MVRELMIAAAAGAMFMGSASAEPASDEMNLGMMHWIRDTVCTPDREIVFVPVSHDIPTLQGSGRSSRWTIPIRIRPTSCP